MVEQGDGFGRGDGTVIQIAGDDDEFDLVFGDQSDDAVDGLRLFVKQ